MDPDQPTRRLPPTRPGDPPPLHEYDDDRAWRAHVLDRLDSLRTALVLLGVLSVAALGVAVYALITAAEDEGGGGDGVNPARLSGIEDRIDDLESRLEDRATRGDVRDVAEGTQELGDRVEALEDEAGEGGDIQAVEQSLEDLDQRVAELEQRVEDLEAQQQSQP